MLADPGEEILLLLGSHPQVLRGDFLEAGGVVLGIDQERHNLGVVEPLPGWHLQSQVRLCHVEVERGVVEDQPILWFVPKRSQAPDGEVALAIVLAGVAPGQVLGLSPLNEDGHAHRHRGVLRPG